MSITLLESGANIHTLKKENQTPAQLAKAHNHDAVFEYLTKQSGLLNQQ